MAKQKISYEPQTLDLTLYGGDGVSFRLIVTDILNAPMDLTGTMRAYIRLNRAEYETPEAEFDIDDADASDGIIVISLTGDQTAALIADLSGEKFSGVWDVEWTGTDEEPLTLLQGKLECVPDVTH